MTQAKLAALVGVSVASVSKAFSGSTEISEETREAIFAAAKREGCFDKYYKTVRERPLIGLLFPEADSEYYGGQIDMLEAAFAERGADTIIGLTKFDSEREERLFRELSYKLKVDGVIISGAGELVLNPTEIPLITISEIKSGANADNIRIAYDEGLLTIVSTLKEYGHKKIAFIGERLTKKKELEFKRAMRRVGLAVYDGFLVSAKSRFDRAGWDCMEKIISSGELPDAIVAAYDSIAYGAMSCARNHGLKIPEDISFVGINDYHTSRLFDVPLSSLRIDFAAVCDRAVELIFKRIGNKHYRSREEIVVPTTLSIRQSICRRK